VSELCHIWNANTQLPSVFVSVLPIGKGKTVPLQAWSGPEGSRKLRFPDFMTTAQDGGKVVSPTHWPHLPQEILLVQCDQKDYVNEKFQ
jgi:hypothetical protein